MTISLSSELEKSISELIGSGDFSTPSEVLEAGLRLLKKQRAIRAEELNTLRAKIDSGIQQLDAGLGVDADAAFDEVERELFGESAS